MIQLHSARFSVTLTRAFLGLRWRGHRVEAPGHLPFLHADLAERRLI
jgi:hypothetical protein